jgi:hypothetical protein
LKPVKHASGLKLVTIQFFALILKLKPRLNRKPPKKHITNEEKPLWQRVAPRLRIAEVDWEPVVNAIIKERPVLKKDASAIIKALIGGVIEGKVAPTAVYGYAGTIIYFLGVEGLLEWDGTAKGAINWK